MLSIEAKFNEIVEALTKAGLYKTFKEEFTDFTKAPMEVKVNCGLAILKRKGIIESITESGWGLTFTETAPHQKHNGVGDNYTEGNPFNRTEGRSAPNADNNTKHDPFAAGDALMLEAMRYPRGHQRAGEKLSEADKRKAKGLPPVEYDALNESQKKAYDQSRMFGISEVDSFILAKL